MHTPATFTAGIDEVGRGCLAGPLVVACVVLPDSVTHPYLRDSKRLTPRRREEMASWIRQVALMVSIEAVGPAEIDSIGIERAFWQAVARLVRRAREAGAAKVVIDGVVRSRRLLPPCLQESLSSGHAVVIPHAEDRCSAVAAASIVAKVHRDAMAAGWEREYPGYGWARHKGYPTREHYEAIARLGITPLHRRSFDLGAAGRGSCATRRDRKS